MIGVAEGADDAFIHGARWQGLGGGRLHALERQSIAAFGEFESDVRRGWRGAVFDGEIEFVT